jgi:hypothetical protein
MTRLYALALAACSQSYMYMPDTVNAQVGGVPAAKVGIPQEAPQGSIQLVSYGVTEADGNHVLRVQFDVSNDADDRPWRFDPCAQRVEIEDLGRVHALGAMRSFTVVRYAHRVVDLYFPLPPEIRSNHELPRFDMLWQVDTGRRLVASRTEFDRVDEDYTYAYAEPFKSGHGYYPYPYWWYAPMFPATASIHSRRAQR